MSGYLITETIFNGRVENYMNYRPTYPASILDLLNDKISFSDKAIVADIGSGTGIATEMFINNGNKVYAVEPNDIMRQVAEKRFINNRNYRSIKGISESTYLDTNSVDLIVVAQAFHWFDGEKTSREFRRILKDDGYILILFNYRKSKPGFMDEYRSIINKYKKPYKVISDEKVLTKYYNTIHTEIIQNTHMYNSERLIGDTTSYSYIPNEKEDNYIDLKNDLVKLFDEHVDMHDLVEVNYETAMYICKLKSINKDLNIRKSNSEDLPFIALVCRDAAGLYDSLIPGAFEKQAKKYEEDGLPKKYTIRIISSNGTDIGFCAFNQLDDKTSYLIALYILSKYRKMGYGKLAVDDIIEKVKLNTSEKIVLLVHKEAQWAIDFYQKYGFEIIAENKTDIISNEPLLENYYMENTMMMQREYLHGR